ncbi:hypothetical protein LTR99_002217 [Exophiala xenobiotica]|uniref:GST N-terminal domain-containing protein n=1 Tax=Vermiconidia calcicola TaxID=1690605 RepID=A0AAV9QKG7_9PEZI|nr:hypothetical protein LTR92_004633 [Exophiala xenobiotica]KAK5542445.1 hypothetical protein LTR25_002330 [Vermiconidia calcicola]KAK5546303.1 hypothetical protein LTR23_003754 [Chaetothyriales sp. CCFEE 6169]KAK5272821.1 hypothetical protein LTR96_002453 [Exophiala xenobiotica]KAK5306525.1 hypothetical protein LTR99_002217 [Exophiala xenobiotica]
MYISSQNPEIRPRPILYRRTSDSQYSISGNGQGDVDIVMIREASSHPDLIQQPSMAPKITLYTAHHCPFAHRSQIVLRELGLEFETVLVDITIPRTPEYLAINPRGMVPALRYDDLVLTESGLISQFLVDSHPSHLLKSSSEPAGALQRFNIAYFVDTYFSKAQPHFDLAVQSAGEAGQKCRATVF